MARRLVLKVRADAWSNISYSLKREVDVTDLLDDSSLEFILQDDEFRDIIQSEAEDVVSQDIDISWELVEVFD